MPWTTPITWTTSQVVTAANLNTHVRDNENFLRAFHGARLWQSGALSQTATSAFQLTTWDTEDYDSDAIGDPANEWMVAPTGFDGYWRVFAHHEFANDATGSRQIRIVKNETYAARAPNGVGTVLSSQINPAQAAGTHTHGILVEWTGPLVAGDHLTVEAFQASGGNLAYQVGKTTMWFEAHYLGN